jgi:predicted O-methyltransferase YrrM
MSAVWQPIRATVGACYRRLASPVGRRAIRRARGLPPQLEPVLASLFAAPSSGRDPVALRIEQRRADLAAASVRYGYVAVATRHEPSRWAVALPEGDAGQPTVSSRWVAQSASVPPHWGRFLRACGDAVPPGIFLELGALAGISGAYLAAGRGCERLVTIDGSPTSAAMAAETFAAVGVAAEVIEDTFDAGLDRLLGPPTPPSRFSLAFVDGHHDRDATRAYAGRIAPALVPGGLLLLDDITLNAGMWATWMALSGAPGWAAALHVGRVGVLLRDPDARQPRCYDFSRYTGWWPIGGDRRTTTCPPESQR